MKKCPRCNELIGDELEICPICHTEFTEKQLEEMKKAVEMIPVPSPSYKFIILKIPFHASSTSVHTDESISVFNSLRRARIALGA